MLSRYRLSRRKILLQHFPEKINGVITAARRRIVRSNNHENVETSFFGFELVIELLSRRMKRPLIFRRLIKILQDSTEKMQLTDDFFCFFFAEILTPGQSRSPDHLPDILLFFVLTFRFFFPPGNCMIIQQLVWLLFSFHYRNLFDFPTREFSFLGSQTPASPSKTLNFS